MRRVFAIRGRGNRVPQLKSGGQLTALLFPVCAAMAAAVQALAAEIPSAGETALLDEMPVVISATRLRQPLDETPVSVTVIDRAMIEASGMLEAAELLRLVPGFQVGRSAYDPAIAVTAHGQSSAYPERLQVLVDGRSVYSSGFSSVDWNNLGVALEDIDRIEVVRGPSSPVYGANAFTGAVNIITRQPFQDRGWTVRAAGGDANTRSGLMRYAGSAGALDYRVSVTYDASDGFEGVNDGERLDGVSFRGVYEPGARDRLDIQLGYNGGEMGRGYPYPPEPNRDVERHYQYLRWSRVPGAGREGYLQLYHNYQRDREVLRDLTYTCGNCLLEGLTYDNGAHDHAAERFDVEGQYQVATGARLRLLAGAGLRLDRFRSELLTGREDFVDNLGARLFAQAEYRLGERWLLNAGAMLESSDIMDPEISPRLGLTYRAADRHSFRIGWARAVRSPSLLNNNWDKTYTDTRTGPERLDWFSNTIYVTPQPLDPERLEIIEAGYFGQWLDGRLTTDVRLFHQRIRDEIWIWSDVDYPECIVVVDGTCYGDGARVGDNGWGTDTTGLELDLRYRPAGGGFLSLAYALADADSDTRLGGAPEPGVNTVRDRNADLGTPRHTLSLLAGYPLPGGLEASLGYYYVSEMGWYGDGDRVDPYRRLDLRLAREFPVGATRGKIELIGQNLDGEDREFSSGNRLGARVFLRATLELD